MRPRRGLVREHRIVDPSQQSRPRAARNGFEAVPLSLIRSSTAAATELPSGDPRRPNRSRVPRFTRATSEPWFSWPSSYRENPLALLVRTVRKRPYRLRGIFPPEAPNREPREGGELRVQVQGYVTPILGSRQAPVKSPLAQAEVEPRPETYPEHHQPLRFQPKDTTTVTESKSP